MTASPTPELSTGDPPPNPSDVRGAGSEAQDAAPLTSAAATWNPRSRAMTLTSGGCGAVLVDPHVLRRVIQRHRRLTGIGLVVPHDASYVIDRAALLEIVDTRELGDAPLSDVVVLLPRPDADGTLDGEVLRRLWRAAFHARVHVAYDEKLKSGALTPAAIRERIHRLGHCEFDEARIILKQENLLLEPRDDAEAWIELAATYLELRHFAPGWVEKMFPVLTDLERVDAQLGEDVDVTAILLATRPAGASETTPPAPPSSRGEAPPPRAARDAAMRHELLARAERARAKGNRVRAALSSLAAAAADGAAADEARADEAAAIGDLDALAASLAAAIGAGAHAPHGGPDAWARAFEILARRAVHGTFIERGVEARALFDVQKACLEAVHTPKTVELAPFLRSFGKKPIVRPLPAAREVLIARRLRAADERAARARLPRRPREEVHAVFHALRHEAVRKLRAALRPHLEETFAAIGLTPSCAVERVAQGTVVEQLLDATEARGFFGIGQLRDALSRNGLKLPNVTPGQLARGDALLRADRRLDDVLDGVYREGEIYLRALQKVSSLAFGTRLGRFLSLYLAIPLGASFVALEGTSHLVSLVSELAGGHEVLLVGRGGIGEKLIHPNVLALAAILFLVIHVRAARRAARAAARAVGRGLYAVFVAFPRWFFARSWTRALFASRPFKILLRYVLRPALFAAGAGAIVRSLVGPRAGVGVAAGAFVVFAVAFNTPVGVLAEELAIDWVLRRVSWLTNEFFPGLYRLVVGFFARVLELIERALYAVDEWLRFREGEHPVALAAKVFFGFIWFFIAYVVRLYTNLLIEPQVNPIKHFPVVTVSHKIVLPFAKKLGHTAIHAIAPYVGRGVAVTIVPPTVLLLPGVFGFLVWELRANFQLYAQNRAPTLAPVAIGHHGEDMTRLLRPGLHSGTVPKIFAKLRRAAKKAEADGRGANRLGGDGRGANRLGGDGRGASPGAGEHEEELAELREAIERFVDREVVALLRTSPAWTSGALEVAHVELAPSRVRVSIARAGAPRPLVISFEEQSGFLVAGVSSAGFADELGDGARVVLENAIAVLYRLAGVALSRETLAAALGHARYDVADEGLVVWPTPGYRTEIVYALTAPRIAPPTVRGEAPAVEPKALDMSLLLLRERPIAYAAFREAWEASIPARLESGASLLPERVGPGPTAGPAYD